MISAMTFDTIVDMKEGHFIIPRIYREQLLALAKQGQVRITISPAEPTEHNINQWQETHETLISYLLDNPISTHADITADKPIRMTREQLHER